jgi:predicted membrane protein
MPYASDPEGAACFLAQRLQQQLQQSGRDMGSLQQLLARCPDHTPEQLLPDLHSELWQEVLQLKKDLQLAKTTQPLELPKYLYNALLEVPRKNKYVRCVAVATYPAAWLNQQQQGATDEGTTSTGAATDAGSAASSSSSSSNDSLSGSSSSGSTGSSSSSDSSRALWMRPGYSDEEPAYSLQQLQLWKRWQDVVPEGEGDAKGDAEGDAKSDALEEGGLAGWSWAQVSVVCLSLWQPDSHWTNMCKCHSVAWADCVVFVLVWHACVAVVHGAGWRLQQANCTDISCQLHAPVHTWSQL